MYSEIHNGELTEVFINSQCVSAFEIHFGLSFGGHPFGHSGFFVTATVPSALHIK